MISAQLFIQHRDYFLHHTRNGLKRFNPIQEVALFISGNSYHYHPNNGEIIHDQELIVSFIVPAIVQALTIKRAGYLDRVKMSTIKPEK